MVAADPSIDSTAEFKARPHVQMDSKTSTRAHVLLVEDNTAVGETIVQRLRREGYRVTWVQDGFHALAGIEERVPDAIIMDLMLPRMNGTASTRQIRWSCPSVPIIGISSLANTAMIEEFLEAGGSSFIDKRHMSPDLFDQLRDFLREN